MGGPANTQSPPRFCSKLCLGLCISSPVCLGSEPNQVWAGLQEPGEQRQKPGQGTWRQSSNSLPVRRLWILEPTCLHQNGGGGLGSLGGRQQQRESSGWDPRGAGAKPSSSLSALVADHGDAHLWLSSYKYKLFIISCTHSPALPGM